MGHVSEFESYGYDYYGCHLNIDRRYGSFLVSSLDIQRVLQNVSYYANVSVVPQLVYNMQAGA
jgi:hypothetical protein